MLSLFLSVEVTSILPSSLFHSACASAFVLSKSQWGISVFRLFSAPSRLTCEIPVFTNRGACFFWFLKRITIYSQMLGSVSNRFVLKLDRSQPSPCTTFSIGSENSMQKKISCLRAQPSLLLYPVIFFLSAETSNLASLEISRWL